MRTEFGIVKERKLRRAFRVVEHVPIENLPMPRSQPYCMQVANPCTLVCHFVTANFSCDLDTFLFENIDSRVIQQRIMCYLKFTLKLYQHGFVTVNNSRVAPFLGVS